MTNIKNKFSGIKIGGDLIEDSPSKNTFQMLKQAWSELPTDFTMGERTLFIEIAERLVKAAGDSDRRVN